MSWLLQVASYIGMVVIEYMRCIVGWMESLVRRLFFPSASVFHNMIRMRNIHEDAVFFIVIKRKWKFLSHFASLKVEQVLEKFTLLSVSIVMMDHMLIVNLVMLSLHCIIKIGLWLTCFCILTAICYNRWNWQSSTPNDYWGWCLSLASWLWEISKECMYIS